MSIYVMKSRTCTRTMMPYEGNRVSGTYSKAFAHNSDLCSGKPDVPRQSAFRKVHTAARFVYMIRKTTHLAECTAGRAFRHVPASAG